jgi:hypothetical protein
MVAFLCNAAESRLQQRYEKATNTLLAATTEIQKFHALNKAAKESFNVGKIENARTYATELLALSLKYKTDWNYGSAIQDGNIVMGRIAWKEGRVSEAKSRLLDAGKSPGSPVMSSFGPNMSLAKDLLQAGQKDSVLEYFELCRRFWSDGAGTLDRWAKEVKGGKIPNFGANLYY